MKRFTAKLVPGSKPPYSSWTFIVIPADIPKEWRKGRFEVSGTLNGQPFRGKVAKGEGVHRMPIKREVLDRLGLFLGAEVEVAIQLELAPTAIELPAELQKIIAADPSLAEAYAALAPSMQRAWSAYISEAKRPETKLRRVEKASAGIRARIFPNS